MHDPALCFLTLKREKLLLLLFSLLPGKRERGARQQLGEQQAVPQKKLKIRRINPRYSTSTTGRKMA
jgi:hypothetical protein